MKNVIHVGLGKCGSTFLQRHFFPNIPGYEFVSTYSGTEFPKELNFIYEINKDFDSLDKNNNRALGRIGFKGSKLDNWKKLVDSYLNKKNSPILLSSEGLCGISYSPSRNNYDLGLLLKVLFGKSKIIFVYRKHADYLESLYRQLVFKEQRFGRYLDFSDFFSVEPTLEALSTPRDLDWSRCVRNYQDIFGKENVLAIPYELMKTDLPRFVKELEEFISTTPRLNDEFWKTHENKSPSKAFLREKGILRRSRVREFSGLNLETRNAIDEQFRADCRELAVISGFDLASLGYVL